MEAFLLGLFNIGVINGWAFGGGLALFIVVGAFREWWIPGPVHRRAVAAAKLTSDSLAKAVETIKKLVESQRIVDYFFENVLPHNPMSPKKGTRDTIRPPDEEH
jgi:hypothetical protein